MIKEQLIGSQRVLDAWCIGPPDYELMDWQIEETIDCLLDTAVAVGEAHSQAHFVRTGEYAPYAHRGCTSYHAIEAIRHLQAKVEYLQGVLSQTSAKNGDGA